MSILLSYIVAKFVKTSRTSCTKTTVGLHVVHMCIPSDIAHVVAIDARRVSEWYTRFHTCLLGHPQIINNICTSPTSTSCVVVFDVCFDVCGVVLDCNGFMFDFWMMVCDIVDICSNVFPGGH